MRAISIFLLLCSVLFLSPNHASAQTCDGPVLPLTMFACYDMEVAALEKEVTDLYTKRLSALTGSERSALSREHDAWSGGLAAKCGLDQIPVLFGKEALLGHACL